MEIENLVKRYPKAEALSGVSLTIGRAEIFALLGPNGAGKTTLIGAVCGLIKKTSGTIRVFGKDLDRDPIGPRYDMGLVPQEVNFDPFFTIAESLRIQQGFYGRAPDEARIDEVLTALNLINKKDALTRALSGGMKRRLLIAKALVHRPRLVFLDEPTAGVDVELRRDLWAYVKRLREEGTTVILTTHYLEEAEELADRVGIIDQGKLLLVESKTSLMQRLGERTLTVTLEKPLVALPAEELLVDGLKLVYLEKPGRRSVGEVLKLIAAAGGNVVDIETRRSRLEDILLTVLRPKVGAA